MNSPAAFIDRDGVINEDRGYVSRIDDFFLLPGVLKGLSLLQSAGYSLVVITNQAGIARGLYTENEYIELTEYMINLLSKEGIYLSAVYHSPYHPVHGLGSYKINSNCRKPNPGMILRARNELGIDLNKSILIGDKRSDIEAGKNAGVSYCLLVRSGNPVTNEDIEYSDGCFDNLYDAAKWVMNR